MSLLIYTTKKTFNFFRKLQMRFTSTFKRYLGYTFRLKTVQKKRGLEFVTLTLWMKMADGKHVNERSAATAYIRDA